MFLLNESCCLIASQLEVVPYKFLKKNIKLYLCDDIMDLLDFNISYTNIIIYNIDYNNFIIEYLKVFCEKKNVKILYFHPNFECLNYVNKNEILVENKYYVLNNYDEIMEDE